MSVLVLFIAVIYVHSLLMQIKTGRKQQPKNMSNMMHKADERHHIYAQDFANCNLHNDTPGSPLTPAPIPHFDSLEEHLSRIPRTAFVGAVGTLESRALAQSFQGLLGNHMPARHHHRGILIRSLLLRYWADKDGMEQVGGW